MPFRSAYRAARLGEGRRDGNRAPALCFAGPRKPRRLRSRVWAHVRLIRLHSFEAATAVIATACRERHLLGVTPRRLLSVLRRRLAISSLLSGISYVPRL